MKVICSRQELVEALSNVSRAAASKSPLKVIEGILFRATANGIYLCCYNLEIGIAKTLDATVSEQGEVVMPLRLCEYARRMNGDKISIECNEKYAIHISSGYAAYDIIGMPAIDFPELPKVESEHNLMIPQNILRSMITQTSHAISTISAMPPQYSGILFELHSDSIRLVALDGFRIALRNEATTCGEECSFIVPAKTISEMTKLLSDTEDAAELLVAKSNIIFKINGYNLISRLMNGTFMNYEATMEKTGEFFAIVKTSDMISAVERVSLIIVSESDSSPVCCTFSKDMIDLLCETSTSRAVDNLGCQCSAESENEIGFSHRYLLDALRAVDDEKIMIRFQNGALPIHILPLEGDRFKYLIMPVRLKPTSTANSVASRAGDPKPREKDELDEPEEVDFGYDEFEEQDSED